MARFKIDQVKCTTPLVCKKCLEICPQAVFFIGATTLKRFTINDPQVPGNYKVVPMYRDKCTICNKCIEVCPLGAIEVKPTREEAIKA